MPGIVAAAPQVIGDVIATYGTKTMNLNVHGVEPEQQSRVTTIGDDILEGSFTRLRTTADGIIIGKGVADVLGAKLDDSITLASSTGGKTTARVVGIFRTGVTPVDYSPRLHAAQQRPDAAGQEEHRQRDHPAHRRLHPGPRVCRPDRNRCAATRPKAGRNPTRTS